MTSDQATLVLQMGIEDYEQERVTTRKVLAALPNLAAGYKPDEHARTALALAFHIAYSEKWFLDGIADGVFRADKEERPSTVKNMSDVVAWWDKEIPPSLDKVKKVTPEQAARIADFFGTKFPTAIYMKWLLNHTIHHRGQLSTYIRPNGGKVPSIYGGSYDEPWQG